MTVQRQNVKNTRLYSFSTNSDSRNSKNVKSVLKSQRFYS